MLNYAQLGLGAGVRGERVDTARMLLVAEAMHTLEAEDPERFSLAYLAEVLDVPAHNDVPRLERAREMLAVWRFYPPEFRAFAYRYPPPWHLLREPAGWPDVDRDEVVSFFRERMERDGAWPTIGALRHAFGRASNHRPGAEKTPGQETLGGVA